MYDKNLWKIESENWVKEELLRVLKLANTDQPIVRTCLEKGIGRQLAEKFSTAEAKAEFLNMSEKPTIENLFESSRGAGKTSLINTVVELGILPENIAETMTAKQLDALIKNFNKD